MQRGVWFTWETQRRNEILAAAFRCRLARFDHCRRHALVRYPLSAYQTVSELYGRGHRLVFAQCPSIVLCLVLSALRHVRRFTLILDVHNVIFEQARSGSAALRAAIRYCFRRADYVIVSNENLIDEARANGGTPLVLPDRVPDIAPRPMPERLAAAPRPVITFICTYADDEPVELFLQAMERVDRPFQLFITGRRTKAGDLLRYESEKVAFVDFLPEEDFDGLIRHSDLLVDLTTRDHCLVCGAYEAIGVGTPVLLSDTAVNRSTFSQGCLYAKNELEDYVRQVERFLDDPERYRSEMVAFRPIFEESWEKLFAVVESKLPERK